MPSRKLEYKSSHEHDRKPEGYYQENWYDSYEDIPPSEVRDGFVAKYINCYGQGNNVRCRNGTYLWTNTKFPAMGGQCNPRTGYSAHKVGNQIISDSGDIFTEDDVSNLFGWDNGLYDEITAYVDAQTVTVRDSDENIGTACFLRGKLNLWTWHTSRQLALVQLADEFFLVNREHTLYTRVALISGEAPSNGISEAIEDGQNFIVNNSKGVYRILIDEDPPQAYKLNTPVPSERLESNDDEGDKLHKFQYLYSMNRLERGTNFRDRESVMLWTESGVNEIDENRIDWSVIYDDDPIGTGLKSYGVLDGADLGARTDPAVWVETDGTFRINVNRIGEKNIICDFSNIADMYDVALVIQDAMRIYFPNATCEYLAERANPCFKLTSGRIKDGDISYVRSGVGGTNIAAVMACREVDGAVKTNPPVDVPKVIRGLTVPLIPNTENPERHWTHYSIYRTANLGRDGYHRDVDGKTVVNSQDQYIHVKDLRIGASFYARVIDGYIEARYGEFEQADVGSVIEFSDGTRLEIGGYVNPQLVTFNDDYYYDVGVTGWMGAAIGNGRVLEGTQNQDTVHRTDGNAFESGDEGNTIIWPDGARSIIRCRISNTQARVWDRADRNLTGFTISPTTRNINDIMDDDTLFGRASGWTCRNRFLTPLPRSNMISRQPGFMLFGIRGDKYIHYCHLESSYKYFIGYYQRDYQRIEVEDQVLAIVGFPLQFSAMCQGSIWTGVTNNAQLVTIPETGQIIPTLQSLDKIASIGLANWGSISFIEDDWIKFITNTGEVRNFNGREFGPDETADQNSGEPKFKKAIENAHNQFTSIYLRLIGYLAWWRAK